MIVTQEDIDGVLERGLGHGAPPADITECPINYEEFSDADAIPFKTPCAHWFCKDCIVMHLRSGIPDARKCPYCRTALFGAADTPEASDDDGGDEEDARDDTIVVRLREILVDGGTAGAQDIEDGSDDDYQSDVEAEYDSDEDMSDLEDDDIDDNASDYEDTMDSEDDEDPDGDYEP